MSMALRDRKSFSTPARVLGGADDACGVQFIAGDGAADHVDPVESCFGVDVGLVPGDGQGGSSAGSDSGRTRPDGRRPEW
jgi:hypothetical protein